MENSLYNNFKEQVETSLEETKPEDLVIVSFSGGKGSGKSFFANILEKDYGFTRIAFAEKLKDLLNKYFGLTLIKPTDINCYEKLETIKRNLASFTERDIIRNLYNSLTEIFDKHLVSNFFVYSDRAIEFKNIISNVKTFEDLRLIYQYFGTDICRYIKQDVWVHEYENNIKIRNLKRVVTDDTRFPNEIACIKKIANKFLIFIIDNNMKTNIDSHESENTKSLIFYLKKNQIDFNCIINNRSNYQQIL